MNITTQVQHGMSSQVKRGVMRWAVRETMGVVMLALLLFLTAGTVNWLAGWAMVIVMAGWVIATAIVVIPRCPELLAERVGTEERREDLGHRTLELVRRGDDDSVDRGRLGRALWLVERDRAGGADRSAADGHRRPRTGGVGHQCERLLLASGAHSDGAGTYRRQRRALSAGKTSGVFGRDPVGVGRARHVGVLVGIDSGRYLCGTDDRADGIGRQDLAGRITGLHDYAQRTRYRLLPGVW